MEIIRSPRAMQQRALSLKRHGKTIGFVPTMGFLHEGHLSLMRLARKPCDVLVVSIFVNPTQFGPHEDLDAYPRDFSRDEQLSEQAGVDLIFYPEPATMYATDASIGVHEDSLSVGLCGGARPGHFHGVCTVVAKLFNLVQPDWAVFGEKDAQQLRVIERMVRDLNFPVQIIRGPILREPDGLAMSSRNTYLSSSQRHEALGLHHALHQVSEAFKKGEHSCTALRNILVDSIATLPRATLDYAELVDDASLIPIETVHRPALVALAVNLGGIRLIDNLVLSP